MHQLLNEQLATIYYLLFYILFISIANITTTLIGVEGGGSHKMLGRCYVNIANSQKASIGAISPPHITQNS